MTDERRWRDDEQAIHIAFFRYQVIAPILESDRLLWGEMGAMVDEISSHPHHLPGHGPIAVKPRTIYEWLSAYRRYGLDGLRPCLREDKGKRRVLEDKVLDRAVILRKENPRRKTSKLIDIMVLEKTIEGEVPFHRATLDRHLSSRGASRRQIRVVSSAPTIKMEVKSFGDFWVGDYHHGPLVLAPGEKVVTAKIAAILDHCCRYPVVDRYYDDEELDTLRDSMLRAFLRWGRPKKLYVDNGSVYRSEQLAFSLDRIGTTLVHSRPYYSKGRGLIERWWQLVKDFESEVALLKRLITIHELNRLWEAYRERNYCQEIHSELSRTPAEAISEVTPRGLDPEVVRELFLVKEERKVHRESSCVQVKNRHFLCDSSLRRQWVHVRYDPNDLSSVLIFKDGCRIQQAFPQPINARPQRPPEIGVIDASVDYLALIREDYDRQLLEHARPLAYAKLKLEPEFDNDKFIEVITALAGLSVNPTEKRELLSFWKTLGPFPEDLVRIGTEHAVRLHGRNRHVRVYLAAIRTLVLAHWRSVDKTKKEIP